MGLVSNLQGMLLTPPKMHLYDPRDPNHRLTSLESPISRPVPEWDDFPDSTLDLTSYKAGYFAQHSDFRKRSRHEPILGGQEIHLVQKPMQQS